MKSNQTLPAATGSAPANTVKGQIERGILFSVPMVRATLDGRKTQTRRIEKAFPEGTGFVQKLSNDSWEWSPDGGFDQGIIRARCPYGQPGDRLWGRETWRYRETQSEDLIQYRADNGLAEFKPPTDLGEDFWDRLFSHGDDWRPSIFMPRWASRITLEITKIRVERLQEITPGDCHEEGIPMPPLELEDNDHSRQHWAYAQYAQLWDSIHGVGAWDKNPWVWVIDFCRVQTEKV